MEDSAFHLVGMKAIEGEREAGPHFLLDTAMLKLNEEIGRNRKR